MTGIGIQCALCHSTVDDSFAPGIGHRLDAWANRDLNVGAIISLAPNLAPVETLLGVDDATLKTVLAAWGPGKFDAEVFLDGKGFQPDGKTSAATLIPPAFGLAGVNLHTWTGWGSVTYWNAFVANLEMHGKGTFYDPRLNAGADGWRSAVSDCGQSSGIGNVRNTPDLDYAQAGEPPDLPACDPGTDAARRQLRRRGGGPRQRSVRVEQAKCATCHVPPLFTEPGYNMHTAAEIGIDDFQANRSPDHRYRTAPLRGLFSHMKGGFYHDGRFATLGAVVDHYDTFGALGLTAMQKSDLIEYLKSL